MLAAFASKRANPLGPLPDQNSEEDQTSITELRATAAEHLDNQRKQANTKTHSPNYKQRPRPGLCWGWGQFYPASGSVSVSSVGIRAIRAST